MSFDSTITLKNAANQDVTFLRLNADSSKVTYALSTATLSEPVLLTIGHQMTSAMDGSDRHLVKVSKTVLDTDGRPRTATINVTKADPRLGVTRADRDDMLAYAKSFLVILNVDKLERGEL